jgi:hypothetical protein
MGHRRLAGLASGAQKPVSQANCLVETTLAMDFSVAGVVSMGCV